MDTCVICLNDINQTTENRTLRCNHTFHTKCINGWLSRSQFHDCPVCRMVQDYDNNGDILTVNNRLLLLNFKSDQMFVCWFTLVSICVHTINIMFTHNYLELFPITIASLGFYGAIKLNKYYIRPYYYLNCCNVLIQLYVIINFISVYGFENLQSVSNIVGNWLYVLAEVCIIIVVHKLIKKIEIYTTNQLIIIRQLSLTNI